MVFFFLGHGAPWLIPSHLCKWWPTRARLCIARSAETKSGSRKEPGQGHGRHQRDGIGNKTRAFISYLSGTFIPCQNLHFFTLFSTFGLMHQNVVPLGGRGGGMCMLFEIYEKRPFPKCMGWGGGVGDHIFEYRSRIFRRFRVHGAFVLLGCMCAACSITSHGHCSEMLSLPPLFWGRKTQKNMF